LPSSDAPYLAPLFAQCCAEQLSDIAAHFDPRLAKLDVVLDVLRDETGYVRRSRRIVGEDPRR
jgi:hypothetical protein